MTVPHRCHLLLHSRSLQHVHSYCTACVFALLMSTNLMMVSVRTVLPPLRLHLCFRYLLSPTPLSPHLITVPNVSHGSLLFMFSTHTRSTHYTLVLSLILELPLYGVRTVVSRTHRGYCRSPHSRSSSPLLRIHANRCCHYQVRLIDTTHRSRSLQSHGTQTPLKRHLRP